MDLQSNLIYTHSGKLGASASKVFDVYRARLEDVSSIAPTKLSCAFDIRYGLNLTIPATLNRNFSTCPFLSYSRYLSCMTEHSL